MINQCYSILNTDRESDPGNGTNFIDVYQDDNVLYIYDSFGRKHVIAVLQATDFSQSGFF
jgi:hypothetical protein